MRRLLVQIDGKLPNLALMGLSHLFKSQGDDVIFSRNPTHQGDFDSVHASTIFRRSLPLVGTLLSAYPQASVGGTGVSAIDTLEEHGWHPQGLDYTIYPEFKSSLGYTQRGCRLRCGFCVVPKKEGAPVFASSIADIWRKDPNPREIFLLDNDFFGIPQWRDRITELRDGKFKVCFNQGVNVRLMNEEQCEAVASVNYRDDEMKTKRFYTAWDNRRDENILFRGLEWLCKYGMRPRHLMVYMLIGFPDHGDGPDDWEYRRAKLRAFGAMPYPMPFIRTKESVGFQRYVVRRYDTRVKWSEFVKANYQPRNLGLGLT